MQGANVRGGEGAATPRELWSGLDGAWRKVFRQAWETFRTGNIQVGACPTTKAGIVVHSAPNRGAGYQGPTGAVSGSSVAHAEVDVLAAMGLGRTKELVLTTTLEPCLQCSALTRLGPSAKVRFARSDPLGGGCHDLSPLSRREADRVQVEVVGPRTDELGPFGTGIARCWHHGPPVEAFLGARGEAGIVDLAQELAAEGTISALKVDQAPAELWQKLKALCA